MSVDASAIHVRDGLKDRRQAATALFCCLIFVIVPPVFALTTFEVAYEYDPVRQFSLPILALEGAVIAAAIHSGFRIGPALASLSTITKVAGATLAFVIVTTTVLAPIDPLRARIFFFTTAIHALFALVCWDRFAVAWRSFRAGLIASIILGLSLYVAAVLILALSVQDLEPIAWKEFGAGVSNVRHLGYYGLPLLGFSAGLIASSTEFRANWLVCFGVFLGFFLCDWSGGRAAFGASIVGISLLTYFVQRVGRYSFLKLMGLLFLIAIPASIILAPHPLYGADRILSTSFLFGPGMDANEYTTSRLLIWEETFAKILERPWLGWGEGQFRHGISIVAGKHAHPHNSVLQFLYQWGLIGTAALGAMIVPALRLLPSAIRQEPMVALPALGALSGLAAMSLFDGSFFFPLPIMFSLMSLALITSCKPTSSDTNSPDETSCDQNEPSPKLGDQGAA